MVGYGTVGRCLLPMLRERFGVAAERYLVVDGHDQSDEIAAHRESGVHYQVSALDARNIEPVMSPLLRAGDLLINVSVGVDSVSLADWCHRNGILYVDSSLEPWEEEIWDASIPPCARTEYAYHQRARRHASRFWRADGPTVVVCHGANPGLVSHFVKAALLEVGAATGIEEPAPSTREGWARLARTAGTRVIHISERDTQISCRPKRTDEFVNTWSISGFIEEASMPVEIGWGTHERRLPPRARLHEEGPGNAIYCPLPAARMLLRSWVPLGGPIAGLALPHSECITLSEYLTVEDAGRVQYRPTVAFSYLPCDAALASLHETMMCDWRLQGAERVMDEDIVEGRDELGVLLLGHGLGGWWLGSQLDIHEARKLVPGSNPTAVQVAAGVLAAATWAVANPRHGYCEPEDLPHEEILEVARPYLGPMVSTRTSWTPFEGHSRLFTDPLADADDPWQFGNFLL